MVSVCHEFVFPFWYGSHAYNKGKALVVSKVPLPDYRADLDERHGSSQKEVIETLLVKQILYSEVAAETFRLFSS